MTTQQDFEMVAQRYLSRAHKLRAIQQIIAEDPGIVPDLLAILSRPGNHEQEPPPLLSSSEAGTRRRIDSRIQAEKVAAFFRGRGNTMASVREIAEGAGLSRNVINALLYNSGERQQFKQFKVSPKRTYWRLREGADDTDAEITEEQYQQWVAEEGGEESNSAEPGTE